MKESTVLRERHSRTNMSDSLRLLLTCCEKSGQIDFLLPGMSGWGFFLLFICSSPPSCRPLTQFPETHLLLSCGCCTCLLSDQRLVYTIQPKLEGRKKKTYKRLKFCNLLDVDFCNGLVQLQLTCAIYSITVEKKKSGKQSHSVSQLVTSIYFIPLSSLTVILTSVEKKSICVNGKYTHTHTHFAFATLKEQLSCIDLRILIGFFFSFS